MTNFLSVNLSTATEDLKKNIPKSNRRVPEFAFVVNGRAESIAVNQYFDQQQQTIERIMDMYENALVPAAGEPGVEDAVPVDPQDDGKFLFFSFLFLTNGFGNVRSTD